MTRLYGYIIVSLLYSFCYCKFELVPEESTLEGERGGKLTLTWNMRNIPDGYSVISAILYMGVNVSSKPLFADFLPPLEPEQHAKDIFGGRISATLSTTPPQKYEVTIKNLQDNDTVSFTLRVGINKESDFQPDKKTITISKIKDPSTPGRGDPSTPGRGDPSTPGRGDPEGGSNTGAIVGGVIGGIVVIVIFVLVVFFVLRWKKNQGSSEETTKKLNSGYPTYEAPQYADASVALGNDRQAPSKEYLELGPGGGRVGECTNPPPQSHYHEVKNLDDDDE